MRHLRFVSISLLLSIALLSPATAQESPDEPLVEPPAQAEASTEQAPAPAAGPTIESVTQKIKAIQENKELEEGLKTRLLEVYNRALQALQAAEADLAKQQNLKKEAEEAPKRLDQLKAQLAQAAPDPKLDVPPEVTLAQLDGELAKAKATLNEKTEALKALEAEPARRAERRAQVPQELASARQELDDIQQKLSAKPAPEDPPQLVAANQVLLEALKKAAEARIAALEQEPISYTARVDLLNARRDVAKREVDQAAKRVKAIEEIANRQREREANIEKEKARQAEAQAAHPALKQLAEENTKLAELRATLASKIKAASTELERISNKIKTLEADYANVAEKEKKVGLTEVIGVLLRRQLATLPNLARHRRNIRQRETETAQVDFNLIDYQEQRSGLASIDELVEQKLKRFEDSMSEDERDEFAGKLRGHLETKRDYLDAIINDSNTHLAQLGELDTTERLLVATTQEYRAYINERILWVRSASPLRLWASGEKAEETPSDLNLAVEAFAWLTDPNQWINLGSVLASDALAQPALFAFALLVGAVLLATQRRRRACVRQLGELAARSYTTTLTPTFKTIGATCLLALPWPLLLAFVGWRLRVAGETSEFATAVGTALQATAAVLFSLELCRQACRPKGLGDAHFDWSPGSLRVVRGSVWQLMVIGLPLGFVIAALEWQTDDARQDSLGRLAFVVAMVVLFWELRRVLHFSSGVMQEVLAKNRGGWLDRLRYVWYPLAVGLPLLLAGLALWGYYYTALQLAWRLLLTLWLVFGLLLVMCVTLRWLLLTHRTLAIKQARERRAAQAESKEAGPPTDEGGLPTPIEPEVDLTAISTQSRKLLRVAVVVTLLLGCGLVWADVLPAVGFLRHVQLWPYAVEVTDGVSTTLWISLADVVLALAIALVTIAAAKNLPGLLEITVLQHLPMDPGARFAISTISRYLITVAGVAASFMVIGIGWSDVQWIFAAGAVGLGFGLQEIFANFVSGLILLFERPIRVGDIVSVGDVTGKVTRIRIRATTITDWDLRELVVPNKEFVTGQIINWTLSDTVSRMTINVGVAYGSDTALTQKLLLKVAADHPLVLETPPPHALFDGFGDSTLNFTLRVYMPSRDIYLQLRHELHVAVDNAFRDAGIEIAFPQRDLHIRSFEQPVAIAENHRSKPDGPKHEHRESAPSESVVER